VTDGLLSDNFDSGKYLDGSFWKKTDGRRQIENGRLLLETGQEFVGDSGADNRTNHTDLRTDENLISSADVVEADITLAPVTVVVDNGGNPAEVYAALLIEFRPPGVDMKDQTNLFEIQARLKEGPPGVGVSAEISAVGCADFSCTSKHTIANDNQTFTTPVVEDQPYHLKIEHLGNGAFDITLDSQETRSVDLSSIPGFALTELSMVKVMTASGRTDTPGEEAFVRAFFDNVRVGRP
ncbi:MAG: hypothetical protein KAV87_43290, partial [Desulfobacteraceae bacterium]|nr:hypothetical protein [Desulfobacteraceae bacterium]